MTTQIDKQSQTVELAQCANRANYQLVNARGQHIANIDISKLSMEQLRSIYASGHCILTKRINIGASPR